MARTAPVSLVNSKMYRHFAVISLVITAGLAMFANSENQESLEQPAAESSKGQQAAPKKVASNFKDNRKGGGSFGGGDWGGGGSGALSSDDMIVGPEQVAASAVRMVPDESTALSEGTFNHVPPGMTQEEFRAWQAHHRKEKAPAADEPSASDIAAIVAASRARSGIGAAD